MTEPHPWPRFCTRCGFDLRGDSSAARCPECGHASEPGSIVIAFVDRDTTTLQLLGMAFGVVTIGIVVSLLWALGGRPPVWVVAACLVGFAGLTVGLVQALRRRRAPHRSVVVFGSRGASARTLGGWTSVMPYEEFDAIEIGPRRRNGTRRISACMPLWGLKLRFIDGFVLLPADEAEALKTELTQRVDRAKRLAAAGRDPPVTSPRERT